MRKIEKEPKSPIRFITKAFLAAALYSSFENQNPISKNEQSPTPSHPANNNGKLFANTRMIIENKNKLR